MGPSKEWKEKEEKEKERKNCRHSEEVQSKAEGGEDQVAGRE